MFRLLFCEKMPLTFKSEFNFIILQLNKVPLLHSHRMTEPPSFAKLESFIMQLSPVK